MQLVDGSKEQGLAAKDVEALPRRNLEALPHKARKSWSHFNLVKIPTSLEGESDKDFKQRFKPVYVQCRMFARLEKEAS